tara:strand:- start:2548 stop:2865 length:318 start_codon:yes stop_codon:yes gene_type:complete
MFGWTSKHKTKKEFRDFHSKTDSYAKNITLARDVMGRNPSVSSFKLKKAVEQFPEMDAAAKKFRIKKGRDPLGFSSRKSTGGTRWSAVEGDMKEIKKELDRRKNE